MVRFEGNANLLDSAPELHYTFIEQALRPGGGVALRCAASASPPPRFSWLLDDQPLDHFRSQHRQGDAYRSPSLDYRTR